MYVISTAIHWLLIFFVYNDSSPKQKRRMMIRRLWNTQGLKDPPPPPNLRHPRSLYDYRGKAKAGAAIMASASYNKIKTTIKKAFMKWSLKEIVFGAIVGAAGVILFQNYPLIGFALVAIYALLFFAGFAGDPEEMAWVLPVAAILVFYATPASVKAAYKIEDIWHKTSHVLPTAAALLAIMLLGRIAGPIVLSRLDNIEKFWTKIVGNKVATIITLSIGSLSANIIGLAAGKAVAHYVKSKLRNPDKYADAALATATSLGPGQALLPFAAPAVAIVWATMNTLGISFADYALILYIPLLIGVILPWLPLLQHLQPTQRLKDKSSYEQLFALLLLLATMTIAMWDVNSPTAIAISAIGITYGILNKKHNYKGSHFWSLHQQKELAIAILFIGIDLTGMFASTAFSEGFKALTSLGGGLTGLIVVTALFAAIATSFSDNALATVVGVPSVVLAAQAAGLPTETIQFLVGLLVLCAVLFGLFFPASNLINLPTKQELFPKQGDAGKDIKIWSKASGKYYAIAVIPVIIYVVLTKALGYW
jgi:hypothetical protein